MLQNNYNGKDELGVMVDSNKFPNDDYYGSTAEQLFTNIQERIDYISKERIKLSVKDKWIPALQSIQSMLTIIVENESFAGKMGELNDLYKKISNILPSPPIISGAFKPPLSLDDVLKNEQHHAIIHNDNNHPLINLINDYSQMVEKNREEKKNV
jgi:hypothetical protein